MAAASRSTLIGQSLPEHLHRHPCGAVIGCTPGRPHPPRGPASHHLRTRSMAAITFLMSSLARLRVSARTERPDMAPAAPAAPAPLRPPPPSAHARAPPRPRPARVRHRARHARQKGAGGTGNTHAQDRPALLRATRRCKGGATPSPPSCFRAGPAQRWARTRRVVQRRAAAPQARTA